MNTHVKQLADQIWSLDTEPDPHFQKSLQAFAELIVKECMRLSMLPESDCDNWDYLHLSPAEVIAKHFGVEE